MKKLTENQKETKLSLLEELKTMLEEPGEIPTKAQKVTVMAKDKEGLEEGLDKAKDVVEDLPMLDEEDMEETEADDYENSPECPEELKGKGLKKEQIISLKKLLKL